MTIPESKVSAYYGMSALGQTLIDALAESGKDVDALTTRDLAPFDAFHIRGRMATEELAGWADLRPGQKVIDVGCGIGGTSRYLADAGLEVTGLDLTEEYCRVAAMLSEKVGLGRIGYHVGSALALPFAAGSFDIAWTEHTQMNIADKPGFYGEIARVLKPGGLFAFHDIFAGERSGLVYPVPWASDASISHLIGAPALRELLGGLGFTIDRWEEKTSESVAFFRKRLASVARHGWRQAGLNILMGEEATGKFENLLRNLEAGHLTVIQATIRNGA
jgi:ubiquinone/menaquinone biosynthesis C-methylase UbiE